MPGTGKEGRIVLIASLSILLLLIFLSLYGKFPKDAGISIIYSKNESWGPCPPGEFCSRRTALHSSGLYVVDGRAHLETDLGRDFIPSFVSKARELGFPSINCSAPLVMDYYAEYFVSVDGKEASFFFPGCFREIAQLESLLPEEDDPIGGE